MAKKRLNGEGPIVWHKGIGTAEGRTFLRVHLRAAGVLNTECQLQGCYATSPGHGQARSVHAAGTGSAATRCHMDAVWNDVLQGDAGAVSTALKISERRSRLLGLDAPHSIEARTRIDVLSWSQAIRDFIDIHKEVFSDGIKDERTKILAKRMDELVAKRLGSG
jgi:hypothetical protein